MLLKKASEFIRQVFRNNPLLLLLPFFWAGLLLLNVLFPDPYAVVREPDPFAAFSSPEEKEDFQNRMVSSLRKVKGLNISIHEISQGENYWSIARDHNVDIDTIIGLNPYLRNIYAALKERLIVGDRAGCVHILGQGEDLRSVARLYGISLSELKKANGLFFFRRMFFPLRSGRLLFVPHAKPKLLTEEMREVFGMRRVLQSPLGGRYTSGYGMREDPITRQKRYHNGIDIKVNIGDWVGSASDGTVIEAGWAGGYGKMVKIRHDNGYTTLYGHLSKILVRNGQRVKKGQIIARAGNTGRTTGAHLHFTVWYRGKPVNPALFLW